MKAKKNSITIMKRSILKDKSISKNYGMQVNINNRIFINRSIMQQIWFMIIMKI